MHADTLICSLIACVFDLNLCLSSQHFADYSLIQGDQVKLRGHKQV